MILAHISDTHISLDTPDADRRLSDLERAIADINALDPAPDAIVHTGDISHSGQPEEYAVVAAALAKARVPVHVVAGNKDNRANLRAAFALRAAPPSEPDFIDYTVERYPLRLLVLDTLGSSNRGDFCAERVRRLQDMIDADTVKPVAVFTHHPPFIVTVGPHPLHFEAPEPMHRLQDALQRSGRVVGIFSGHVHRPATGRVGNIPASVVPCTATTLRKGEYPPDMESRPIYHVHRFRADGGFVTESRVVAGMGDRQEAGSRALAS